jgi:hypothetical protein
MNDSKDKPSDRELSKRQARENADAARATRKNEPGVDDDSDVVQSLVGVLGAPVEGALDSIREREQFAERGQDLGPDQVGGISGQRAEDVPNFGEDRKRRARVPQRPEDAEAEPGDIAQDQTPGNPRGRG